MIEKFEIYITPLALKRTIHMYLPDDYYQSEEKYPVLYMFDGHNLFNDQDATYGKSWGLADFLKDYDKKFLVVGMECNHEGNKRLDEYCPYDVENGFFGPIQGEGKQYMQWVCDELKPYIDSHYRTIPFRECCMIGGSSMGGLMALYTVIAHNQIFSKAACLSSAISLCFDQLIDEINHQTLLSDTKVYMDWGSDESRNKRGLAYASSRNLEISHLLNQKGIQTYPYLIINGKHNEETWQKQISIFMDYLWK